MLNQQRNLELNSKGYLLDFNAWDEQFAIELAAEHHITLTDCHWLVIQFLRNYQLEYGLAPNHREIIKQLSKTAAPGSPCSKKHLENMFGEDGCKLACMIAGLPDCHCRSA